RDVSFEEMRPALDGLAGSPDREAQAALLRVERKRDLARRGDPRDGDQGREDRDRVPQSPHPPPPGTKRRRRPIAAAYSGRARSARSSVRTRARRSATKATQATAAVIQAPPARGSVVTSATTAT